MSWTYDFRLCVLDNVAMLKNMLIPDPTDDTATLSKENVPFIDSGDERGGGR